MGRKVFDEFSFMDKFYIFLATYYPKISAEIGISNVQKNCSEFFTKCVNEAVEYRLKHNVKRNDIMQILIDMKEDSQITVDEIIGQVVMLIFLGFINSFSLSTTYINLMGNHQTTLIHYLFRRFYSSLLVLKRQPNPLLTVSLSSPGNKMFKREQEKRYWRY